MLMLVALRLMGLHELLLPWARRAPLHGGLLAELGRRYGRCAWLIHMQVLKVEGPVWSFLACILRVDGRRVVGLPCVLWVEGFEYGLPCDECFIFGFNDSRVRVWCSKALKVKRVSSKRE